MKKKQILITALIIIIISNLPVVSTVLMDTFDRNKIRYANNDASFAIIEDFDILRNYMSQDPVYAFIEVQRPVLHHMEVFRLYRINPLCFWRWRYYILVSCKFRYQSWKDIEPNRTPRIPDNMWQQF